MPIFIVNAEFKATRTGGKRVCRILAVGEKTEDITESISALTGRRICNSRNMFYECLEIPFGSGTALSRITQKLKDIK
jgi:hypothetical protein